MWDCFTSLLSGIRCHWNDDTGMNFHLIKPFHLLWHPPLVQWVSISPPERQLLGTVGQQHTEQTPSAVSDSRGKGDYKSLFASALKAGRKRCRSQNKRQSTVFYLALRLNFFAIWLLKLFCFLVEKPVTLLNSFFVGGKLSYPSRPSRD